MGSKFLAWTTFACASMLVAASVHAQSPAWPVKPIRILIPYGVGSGVDVVVRMLAEPLSKSLGQPIICENRAGAAGTIAANYVLQQPADGYTLLSDSSSHTIAPALNPSLPFDTGRDFVGITTLIEIPLVLVTATSKGYKSVQDVIAAAKANPGKITYASAGVGSSTHISAEKLRLAAGIDALHVPFKSTTDALVEVIAGRVDMTYTALPSAQSGIKDGKLVPLAMVSRKVPVLPDTPAIGDVVPGASYGSWMGVMAPSKVPREIVLRLNQEIVRAMTSQDMRERLAKLGTEPWTQSSDEFDAMRKRELGENERLVKAAGIKM